ncbi:hypothetical protein Q1695_010352 [Nippostrongylus brasiliensis]|nr:hypothetical protein Q1695_010352 [Nippostrongylus brasiliensis]
MHKWRYASVGRNSYFKLMLCLLVLLAVLVIEEINIGTAFVTVMNLYGREIVIPLTTKREIATPIAIVVVVQDTRNSEQYAQAQATVECYATHHKYALHFVVVENNSTWSSRCPQKDFMFQRHCVVAHMMKSWKEEWLLFLDADMAVINPNHLIEEYVPDDPNVHLVFYNRIFNHEVMAGSYLIRNVNYSYDFLIRWSDYEFQLPKSFHGSDNGAIHSVIVSFALPSQTENREKCEKLWRNARDYDTLSTYEVCMQMILSANSLEHIRILEKGKSWARDGWLTNSAWSNRDFIVHGWQKRRKDKMRFARWHSPLVESVWNPALCKSSDAFLNWRYKDTFIKTDEEIKEQLDNTINTIAEDFRSIRATVEKLTKDKVPLFADILEQAEKFTSAHQQLATLMVNKGVLTKKKFCITFIRNAIVVNLKGNPQMVSKIPCTKEDLDGLVLVLFAQMNPHLTQLGFRLTLVTDEEKGNEMVVLVSEDVFSKETSSISGFSEDELTLFAHCVAQMVEGGAGECEINWVLHEVSKICPSMSLMKAQQFLDRLATSGWISEINDHIRLEPRAIAELEPVLTSHYGCGTCVLCQKVVVRKNIAVICESCDAQVHRNCWLRYAASSRGDEISCPGRAAARCDAKFSKSEVAQNFN